MNTSKAKTFFIISIINWKIEDQWKDYLVAEIQNLVGIF